MEGELKTVSGLNEEGDEVSRNFLQENSPKNENAAIMKNICFIFINFSIIKLLNLIPFNYK
ncbi:hypothetical protein GCM10027566_26370 [Arachidicoccus ginsenosidivorans]|jgi:hypothetical protein